MTRGKWDPDLMDPWVLRTYGDPVDLVHFNSHPTLPHEPEPERPEGYVYTGMAGTLWRNRRNRDGE